MMTSGKTTAKEKILIIAEYLIENEGYVNISARAIAKGAKVELSGTTIETLDVIPYGHKMALKPIPKGGTVLKYGLSIGSAMEDIQPGNHVHVHNVESNRGRGDLAE